jgi:RHH-type transcriptional regulator, rel operon repressor / antitoxin RelB
MPLLHHLHYRDNGGYRPFVRPELKSAHDREGEECEIVTTRISVRLPPALDKRLARMAKVTGQSKSSLARSAIEAHTLVIEREEEVRAALLEADAGDFASEQAVAQAFRKWRTKQRRN